MTDKANVTICFLYEELKYYIALLYSLTEYP
jgi:hypothetical protein